MMQIFINELVGAILQLILFCVIPFVWWLIAGRKSERFLAWIGIKKEKCASSLLKMIVIAIAVTGVYALFTNICVGFLPEGVTKAGSQFTGQGIAAIPAAFAYGLIRTGLSEEILFRGFILKRVSNKFGFAAGNTVQALLFGLMHGVPFGLATGNIGVTICLTVLPGLFGWFLGWLNEKQFGGSVIPSWLIHGTVNVITTIIGL